MLFPRPTPRGNRIVALGLLLAVSATSWLVLATSLGQGAAQAVADSDPKYPVAEGPAPAYRWQLPAGFPIPIVPQDNPMSEAKVELGRRLFYDPRLSADGTLSCAGCHRQELAFTDGLARAVGVSGEMHPRGSMSLANAAYAVSLTWDDPDLDRLEEQLKTPLFGHDPIEMGAPRSVELESRLRQDWLYGILFETAFAPVSAPSAEPNIGSAIFPRGSEWVTVENMAEAIAAFERTLISGDSPFDRWLRGEADALSPSARRGAALFFSRRLGCGGCHRGFNLSGPVRFQGSRVRPSEHHNTGLYNLPMVPGTPADGSYPSNNHGLFRHTGKAEDMGRFRAPTLRNIAVTAPYMHDGSVTDLDAVLDHYSVGGRTLRSGPYAGVGSDSPWKSERLTGFDLGPRERQDMKRFLHSLTDEAFLGAARFSDPDPGRQRPAGQGGRRLEPGAFPP